MTPPLETINGKQYQPVEATVEQIETGEDCMVCCFGRGNHYKAPVNACVYTHRADGINVIFIEPGDINEQE